MHRFLFTLFLVITFLSSAEAQDFKDISGSWIAEINNFSGMSGYQQASLTMKWTSDGDRYRYTFSIPVDELKKFEDDQSTKDDTNFTLDREAGELVFSGSIDDDLGSGEFTFSANEDFLHQMSKLGYESISPDEQLKMAIYDVTTTFVKSVRSLGDATES